MVNLLGGVPHSVYLKPNPTEHVYVWRESLNQQCITYARSVVVCVCVSVPEAVCYHDKGADYRGVVATTVAGARCLPWNSELLHDELCVDTVDSAPLRGLGEHSFCRCVDTFYHFVRRHLQFNAIEPGNPQNSTLILSV